MKLKPTFMVMGMLLFFYGPAFAQYPTVPEDLQAKTDSLMELEESRLEQVWEKIYPTVQKEAAEGKPYIPWGSYPNDFVQADIPAFPGAEGGGGRLLQVAEAGKYMLLPAWKIADREH